MPVDQIPSADGTAYAGFSALAIRLITKWGASSTITRTVAVAGSYDPMTGRMAPADPETYTQPAVLSQWTFRRQPTRPIAEGTQRFLFPSQAMQVIPNGLIDSVTFAGTTYKFVSGQIIAPGGIPIVYDMECIGVARSASVTAGYVGFKMTTTAEVGDALTRR